MIRSILEITFRCKKLHNGLKRIILRNHGIVIQIINYFLGANPSFLLWICFYLTLNSKSNVVKAECITTKFLKIIYPCCMLVIFEELLYILIFLNLL